jgi:NADH-quinone oxidoreductase subunit K
MIVPYNHVLILAAALFGVGLFCSLTRRNLIMILLGVEVMLNAAAIAFVGASARWSSLEGQAMALFVLAVAAAEVSVGLSLIVVIYRRSGSADPAVLDERLP